MPAPRHPRHHMAVRLFALTAAGLLVAALTPAVSAVAAPTVNAAAAAEYQAENATISQGLVESNHAGFTGTGFVNYDNAVGSYVEWTVTAATAGNVSVRHPVRQRHRRQPADGHRGQRQRRSPPACRSPAPARGRPGRHATFTAAGHRRRPTRSAPPRPPPTAAPTSTGSPRNVDADTEPPTAPATCGWSAMPGPPAVDLAWDAGDRQRRRRPATTSTTAATSSQTVGGNITTATLTGLHAEHPLRAAACSPTTRPATPRPASNNVDVTTPPSDDTQPPTRPDRTCAPPASRSHQRHAGLERLHRQRRRHRLQTSTATARKVATVPDLTAHRRRADAEHHATRSPSRRYDANGNASPAARR